MGVKTASIELLGFYAAAASVVAIKRRRGTQRPGRSRIADRISGNIMDFGLHMYKENNSGEESLMKRIGFQAQDWTEKNDKPKLLLLKLYIRAAEFS